MVDLSQHPLAQLLYAKRKAEPAAPEKPSAITGEQLVRQMQDTGAFESLIAEAEETMKLRVSWFDHGFFIFVGC